MIWSGIFGSDFCVMVLDFVVKREIKESLFWDKLKPQYKNINIYIYIYKFLWLNYKHNVCS